MLFALVLTGAREIQRYFNNRQTQFNGGRKALEVQFSPPDQYCPIRVNLLASAPADDPCLLSSHRR